MVHEFLHVLGAYHEHNRPDRDDYIKINWQLVTDAKDVTYWEDYYEM